MTLSQNLVAPTMRMHTHMHASEPDSGSLKGVLCLVVLMLVRPPAPGHGHAVAECGGQMNVRRGVQARQRWRVYARGSGECYNVITHNVVNPDLFLGVAKLCANGPPCNTCAAKLWVSQPAHAAVVNTPGYIGRWT